MTNERPIRRPWPLDPTLAGGLSDVQRLDRWGAVRKLSHAVLDVADDWGWGDRWLRLTEHFHMTIGAVGMVRPFPWPEWTEPAPAVDDIATMAPDLVWRHMTRYVRADRTMEGVFAGAVHAGIISRLVWRQWELTGIDDGWPVSLSATTDDGMPAGMSVTGRSGRDFGETEAGRERCADDGCSGWVVEVKWFFGGSSRSCSTMWHHMPDTGRIHVIGGTERGERRSTPTARS